MFRHYYKIIIAFYTSIIIIIYMCSGIYPAASANSYQTTTRQENSVDNEEIENGFLYMVIPLLFVFALFIGYKKSEQRIDIDNLINSDTGNKDFCEAIKELGYVYDPSQDIFYSHLNAWQRNFGYCRLYDEAAAPLHMIIDCEPIYFDYDGKKWLIELWKGQYGMTTGCEIGIYYTEGPDLKISGFFEGTFFNSLKDDELIQMSCILKKNGEKLFSRQDKHWWLTGFILGEFAEPSELIMDVKITLKNKIMRDAFIGGLKKAGYTEKEIITEKNTIALSFDKSYLPQPFTRTAITDWIILRQLESYCIKYKILTSGVKTLPEKINKVRENSAELYDIALNIGKTKKVFVTFDTIKEYLI